MARLRSVSLDEASPAPSVRLLLVQRNQAGQATARAGPPQSSPRSQARRHMLGTLGAGEQILLAVARVYLGIEGFA